jgi:hypothetical protein
MSPHTPRTGLGTHILSLPSLTGAVAAVAVAAAAAAALMTTPTARAATFNHGSFSGSDYTFVKVAESTSEPGALFGAPTVSGNSLDFNPLGYRATAADGGVDSAAGNLVLGVATKKKNGPGINSITINESGDTTLLGNVPPGSMGTASAVFTSGVLDIHEVDGDPINHISVPFSFTFNPSGGTYFLGTDGGGGPLFNTQFAGSVTLSVDQILIANNITGSASRVSLDLNNVLNAVSQAGTSASMAKLDFGLVVHNPEPGALSVGGVALAALALRRRRRRLR